MKLSLSLMLGVVVLTPLGAFAQGNSSNTPASARKSQPADPARAVQPGVVTSTDPTRPPPTVEVAGNPGSARRDAAAKTVPAGLRAKLDADHSTWDRAKGGKAFQSALHYVGGYPIVMLFSRSDEPALVKVRRLQAVVEACSLHLANDAFDRTVVCIAEVDATQPAKVTTRNVVVTREAFEAATKRRGNGANLSAALSKMRGDDSAAIYQQVCAELGIR